MGDERGCVEREDMCRVIGREKMGDAGLSRGSTIAHGEE